jgi:hypothetical protein
MEARSLPYDAAVLKAIYQSNINRMHVRQVKATAARAQGKVHHNVIEYVYDEICTV